MEEQKETEQELKNKIIHMRELLNELNEHLKIYTDLSLLSLERVLLRHELVIKGMYIALKDEKKDIDGLINQYTSVYHETINNLMKLMTEIENH